MGSHTPFYFKKLTTFLFVGISLFLFVMSSVKNANTTKVRVTLEGTINVGSERDQLAFFLETPKGTYYLIDDTDETSRKQKVTKNCPTEGTIACYLNKQVRIDGFVTSQMKWIVPSYKDPPVEARELRVMKFDLLTHPTTTP